MALIEVKKPGPFEEAEMKKFQTWEGEAGSFEWPYTENGEKILVLEGRATVKMGGEEKSFGAGDIVIISKGHMATWTIHEKVRKHYQVI